MSKPPPYTGRKAPKPIQVNLRIPPELHRYIKASAKRNCRSLNGEFNMRLQISRALDIYEVQRDPSSGVSRKPRLTV